MGRGSKNKKHQIANSKKQRNLNDPEPKAQILKQERGISFEEIAYKIDMGGIIGIEQHPVRPNQKTYILEIDDYAVIVPFVETSNGIFLKTAFLSRKYTSRYGLKGGES